MGRLQRARRPEKAAPGSGAGRDECVTARLPDAQWDLVLQSLRASGTNESQLHTIPAAVVVEAGLLVWAPPTFFAF